MSGGHFQYLKNYPGAYFGDFQYYKGRIYASFMIAGSE